MVKNLNCQGKCKHKDGNMLILGFALALGKVHIFFLAFVSALALALASEHQAL